MNPVNGTVERAHLIRTKQLVPITTEKRFSDNPTPQSWVNVPTLRLDGVGARESKREISSPPRGIYSNFNSRS